MKIYNLGSLNIDYVYQVPHFVRPGETLSSREMNTFPGGKGLNQSAALGKAGAEVIHCGLVCENDGWLIDVLRDANVDTARIRTLSSPTGHAIIQVDQGGQNCILLYPGTNHLFTPEYVEEVLADARPGDIVLLQNETNCLDVIFETAHARGLQLAFNPSPFDKSLMNLPLSYVSWWILNELEGGELTGRQNPGEILDAMHESYPKSNIVLTVGRNGSYFRNGTQRLHVPAVPVKAVDTTAAGDTFTGYFLAAIAQSAEIQSALRRASLAASIAVSRRGAACSIPWSSELDAETLHLRLEMPPADTTGHLPTAK